MIKLAPTQWQDIKTDIIATYGRSTVLLRDKMRRELGFVNREHRWYDHDCAEYRCVIMLDFYDDAAETMFRLRYL